MSDFSAALVLALYVSAKLVLFLPSDEMQGNVSSLIASFPSMISGLSMGEIWVLSN